MTEITRSDFTPSSSWRPEGLWWVLLAPILATGLLLSWWLAALIILLLLVLQTRPFDVMLSFLVIVAGSTFLNYQAAVGSLTKQMALLSVGIVWMLFCYLLAKRETFLALPRTPMAVALIAFLLWSAVNTGRGVLAGYGRKPLLLELFPILAVASSLMVANVFDSKREGRVITPTLIVVGYASAALGFYIYSEVRTHITGVYFSIVPGFVALFLFNLALRARGLTRSLAWLVLALPLFLHQFLGFGRGMWLGNIVGIVVSIVTFATSPQPGAWRRSGILVGITVGTGLLGAVALAVLYGQQDILVEAVTRFATIGDTKPKWETMATIARFVEYAAVVPLILQKPWFGHGLGFEFFVGSKLTGSKIAMQYWVHENYLLVWLKQGVVGLLLFIGMLWSFFWTSARHSRKRSDAWESSWLGATAAVTAYITVYSLTDFPFDNVQPMFVLALFWGVSMALTQTGFLRFVWSAPAPRPIPSSVLSPAGEVPS